MAKKKEIKVEKEDIEIAEAVDSTALRLEELYRLKEVLEVEGITRMSDLDNKIAELLK